MGLPGRIYSAGSGYRYGFNGMEKNDEMYGESNSYDFGARVFDSRINRWLSLDPLQKKYPNESHYAFVSNSPLLFKDPDGKDKIVTILTITDKGITVTQKIDKNYFKAEAQSKFYGGYDFVKYNVHVLEVYDYSKTAPKTGLLFTLRSTDYSNPIESDAGEYLGYKFGLSGLGSSNQYVKPFGLILKGGRQGNGWTVDLGGKATHVEELDLGLVLEGAKNLREFEGKQEIADLFEVAFGKHFKPLQKQLMDVLDNADDSKGAVEKVLEKTSTIPEQGRTIKIDPSQIMYPDTPRSNSSGSAIYYTSDKKEADSNWAKYMRNRSEKTKRPEPKKQKDIK